MLAMLRRLSERPGPARMAFYTEDIALGFPLFTSRRFPPVFGLSAEVVEYTPQMPLHLLPVPITKKNIKNVLFCLW